MASGKVTSHRATHPPTHPSTYPPTHSLTGLLGITEKMKDVSVTTEEFLNITIVQPDAIVKTVKAPADPSQQVHSYGLTRQSTHPPTHSPTQTAY